MKKINIVLFGLLVSIVFAGYLNNESSTNNTINQYNQKIDELKQEFVKENDLNVIWRAHNEYEEIIAFENSNEYGIASFYLKNKTDEIKREVSVIPKSDDLKDVIYTEIEGKNDCYMGIFINNNELLKKTNSIMITFSDNLIEKPNKIIQSISSVEIKAQIITYESDIIRTNKSIYLLDVNNQKIYEIE